MSQEFIDVMRAYHAPEPVTRERYLNTAWAGRPPKDEDMDAELIAELTGLPSELPGPPK